MATHSSIPAWENPHGQRSLVGYSPWGLKESDTTKHSTALMEMGPPPTPRPGDLLCSSSRKQLPQAQRGKSPGRQMPRGCFCQPVPKSDESSPAAPRTLRAI